MDRTDLEAWPWGNTFGCSAFAVLLYVHVHVHGFGFPVVIVAAAVWVSCNQRPLCMVMRRHIPLALLAATPW